MREASLLFCLPSNPFYTPKSGHAVQEAAYANVGWIFAQHFLNRLGSPYMALKKLVDENDPTQAQILNDIRTKLRTETFTRQSILEVIERCVPVIFGPKASRLTCSAQLSRTHSLALHTIRNDTLYSSSRRSAHADTVISAPAHQSDPQH